MVKLVQDETNSRFSKNPEKIQNKNKSQIVIFKKVRFPDSNPDT